MIGTCRFCGQMKEVNAKNEEAANEKASLGCSCPQSWHYARRMATTSAVEAICQNYDLDENQVTTLQAVALAVTDGVAVKVNLAMGGLKITVGSKNNGNTYLKIVQSKEDNQEITREG